MAHPHATGGVRLLFVSNLFPDTREPYRGLDNVTLLHALSPHWDIRAIALRPSLPWSRKSWQPRSHDEGLKPRYVPVPYIPRFGAWNHRLYASALRNPIRSLRREWKFDAVLCAWLFPDVCAIERLKAEFGFPYVAIAQGSDVHQYLKMPARRKVMLSHLCGASAIVTRSADLARRLREAGLPSERLHPVYNGVDTKLFRPATTEERREIRTALRLPQEAPVILFVGNFLPIKNPRLLVNAFQSVREMPGLEDCRLVLAGGGPMDAEIRSWAEPLGDSVIFAGRQDAHGISRYMKASNVLALSSHNEGVPNVILEALSTGLPVVSTNVGGISEVHSGPAHGALVAAGDQAAFAQALVTALRHPPDSAAIAAHGARFTWNAAALAYDALLRNAVA